ncbi:glycosyltransferase family 2 protein [Brachybacterium huguangmaarense]
MTPRASVVIAAYGGAGVIGDQLRALAEQEAAPAFEVLVMDNNSPDDLAGAVAPFLSDAVRLVPARGGQGQCYARNLGALLAQGEHVLFCDQDDVVGPRWVASLVSELDRARVLATGPMEVSELNEEDVWRVYLGDPDASPLLRPFPVQGYLPFAFGCNLGIRRDDFLALGGMDNSYRGGDEDTDFSWRAQEAGLPLVVADDAVVHYRLRAEAKALFRQRQGYARTRMLTAVRSKGVRQLRGMSLRWTITSLLRAPLAWVRSRSTMAGRFRWAMESGSLVGNLEGQIRYRVLRAPEPELVDRARPEAEQRAI